jgi:hypothetical protein
MLRKKKKSATAAAAVAVPQGSDVQSNGTMSATAGEGLWEEVEEEEPDSIDDDDAAQDDVDFGDFSADADSGVADRRMDELNHFNRIDSRIVSGDVVEPSAAPDNGNVRRRSGRKSDAASASKVADSNVERMKPAAKAEAKRQRKKPAAKAKAKRQRDGSKRGSQRVAVAETAFPGSSGGLHFDDAEWHRPGHGRSQASGRDQATGGKVALDPDPNHGVVVPAAPAAQGGRAPALGGKQRVAALVDGGDGDNFDDDDDDNDEPAGEKEYRVVLPADDANNEPAASKDESRPHSLQPQQRGGGGSAGQEPAASAMLDLVDVVAAQNAAFGIEDEPEGKDVGAADDGDGPSKRASLRRTVLLFVVFACVGGGSGVPLGCFIGVLLANVAMGMWVGAVVGSGIGAAASLHVSVRCFRLCTACCDSIASAPSHR